MRYQFVLKSADIYSVEKMCKCIKISKNAYYHWFKSKALIGIETLKIYLKKRIRILFEESREIYRSARIQKMLEREDLFYARWYIGLLMKEMNLKIKNNQKVV